MPLRPSARRALLVIALPALAACAKKSDVAAGDSASADSSANTTAPAAAAPAVATSDAEAPLTAADVDRWAKGMTAEREAVLDAGRKVKEAKTATDTMNAMGATMENATRDVAARAAGVSVDRWRTISTSLAAAAGTFAPLSASMDTTKMTPAMLKTFTDNEASERARASQTLPRDVIDAITPRAGELYKQNLELAAQRMKAAGG